VSLFGVSVAAASLPEFSRDSGALALDALREKLRGGWQRILFYVIPSAVVFIVLGDYCVGMLYRAGRFGAAEQRVVHTVLAGYAVGLVSFGSVKLLGSAFYAMQDYRTPLRASMLSIVVSAVAAVGIAVPLRDSPYATAGIAVGSALGSYMNLVVLARGLRERLGTLYTPAMWEGTRRIVLAAGAAGLAGAAARVAHQHWAAGLHVRLAALPVLGVFAVTYLVTAWWMGSAEAARWVRRPVRRRRESGGEP